MFAPENKTLKDRSRRWLTNKENWSLSCLKGGGEIKTHSQQETFDPKTKGEVGAAETKRAETGQKKETSNTDFTPTENTESRLMASAP